MRRILYLGLSFFLLAATSCGRAGDQCERTADWRQPGRRRQRLRDDGPAGSLGHEPEHRRRLVRVQRRLSAGRMVERWIFANGLFWGVVGAVDPNLWLLETAFAGAAPVGKFGVNYPIDANRYRIASVRLCVSTAGGDDVLVDDEHDLRCARLAGTRTTSSRRPDAGSTFVDLATLGTTGTEPWAGIKRSLMLVPAAGQTGGSTVRSRLGAPGREPALPQPAPSRGVAPARSTSISTTTTRRRATPTRR